MKRTAFLMFLFITTRLFADMGAIIPNGTAAMTEPSQKAFILHNGKEEVLILGTDIRVEPAQMIVRFIPFPSKPSVALAPSNTFSALNDLVRNKNLLMVIQTKGANEARPVEELVLNQRLGAHGITVIKIRDVKHFGEWTVNFLKRNGLSTAGLGERTSAVAEDYLKRGFRYFVFDIVKIPAGARSVDPLEYRFISGKLYYPLKTSSLFGGNGTIRLMVCAPTAIDLFGMISRPYEVSTTAVIRPAELKNIFPESGKFFGNGKITPVLQAVRIDGSMEFREDILIDPMKGLKELKADVR